MNHSVHNQVVCTEVKSANMQVRMTEESDSNPLNTTIKSGGPSISPGNQLSLRSHSSSVKVLNNSVDLQYISQTKQLIKMLESDPRTLTFAS